jgi:hypothetical protein
MLELKSGGEGKAQGLVPNFMSGPYIIKDDKRGGGSSVDSTKMTHEEYMEHMLKNTVNDGRTQIEARYKKASEDFRRRDRFNEESRNWSPEKQAEWRKGKELGGRKLF